MLLGVVFGNSPEALQHVDAAKLYAAAPTVHDGMGAVVGEVALVIPAHGVGGGTWFVDLPAAVGAPQAFDLHLLSFSLTDPPPGLLLSLIGTADAANEVAACAALGLTGRDADKARARQNWAHNDLKLPAQF